MVSAVGGGALPPRLAKFDPACLPGLGQDMIDIMNTGEVRHWLHLFCAGLTTTDVIAERFGVEVSEVFEMWAAIQHDNDEAARNCGEPLVSRLDEGGREEGGEGAADVSTSSEASTIRLERPGADSGRLRSADVAYVEPLGEGSGQREDEVEHVGAVTSDAGAYEENNEMDVEAIGETNREASENDGRDAAEAEAKHDGECQLHEGQQNEEVTMGELPTAGLASRPGAGMEEGRDEGNEGDHERGDEQRGAEDELDPLTGIPLRWAQYWRATNTQEDDADEVMGEAAGVDPGAASSTVGALRPSGTEEPTASTTESDRGVGPRQTNLKGWLPGAP